MKTLSNENNFEEILLQSIEKINISRERFKHSLKKWNIFFRVIF